MALSAYLISRAALVTNVAEVALAITGVRVLDDVGDVVDVHRRPLRDLEDHLADVLEPGRDPDQFRHHAARPLLLGGELFAQAAMCLLRPFGGEITERFGHVGCSLIE